VLISSSSLLVSDDVPDFTPSNILLRMSGLDGLTDDQVLEAFGEPQQEPVLTDSGEIPSDP
jgi:hypothetical protein